MPIRVVVVDDHAMVRAGTRLVLEQEADIELAGEAATAAEALRRVADLQPDVVVMDIGLPDDSGISVTRQLKARFPHIKVLGLTVHEDEGYVLELLRAGADGYIVKSSAAADLVDAIRQVMGGRAVLDPAVTRAVISGYVTRPEPAAAPPAPEPDPLTAREKEVLALVAQGLTNAEIAQRLYISIKTVETHRAHIMEKLGARDRTDLVRYAIRIGLIQA